MEIQRLISDYWTLNSLSVYCIVNLDNNLMSHGILFHILVAMKKHKDCPQ